MNRGWLLLAVGEKRQHGGNSGYADSPTETYRWDDTVPNFKAPDVGDMVGIWDKRSLLGGARIESIEAGHDTKLLYRCAECGKANIKRRSKKRPEFLCFDCAAQFDTPAAVERQVRTRTASFSSTWMDAVAVVPAAYVRASAQSPKSQNSIRSIDLSSLRNLFELGQIHLPEPTASLSFGGHTTRLVRVRRGQAVFRANLLQRYGEQCMFSGPCPAEVLEAAHLYSYAETGVHESDGGFLLRRDLHALFDRGLIQVEPASGRMWVDSSIRWCEFYGLLHGRTLVHDLSPRHKRWLDDHRRQFTSRRLQSQNDDEFAPTSVDAL